MVPRVTELCVDAVLLAVHQRAGLGGTLCLGFVFLV